MENTTEVRVKRSEQDIETLRRTQSAMLDRFDSIYKTLVETRNIATENRSRLKRVEERLGRVEDRLGRIEDRLELLEEVVLENRSIILENRAIIRENRAILLNIADHLGLTLETPPQRPQPD